MSNTLSALASPLTQALGTATMPGVQGHSGDGDWLHWAKAHVTFATPFSSAPRVFLQIQSAVIDTLQTVVTSNLTPTGFDITYVRGTGFSAGVRIDWVAYAASA